jgi:hypothetical protein
MNTIKIRNGRLQIEATAHWIAGGDTCLRMLASCSRLSLLAIINWPPPRGCDEADRRLWRFPPRS